ncbi:hypothetical protein EV2_037968 [Malus domestica]
MLQLRGHGGRDGGSGGQKKTRGINQRLRQLRRGRHHASVSEIHPQQPQYLRRLLLDRLVVLIHLRRPA